MQQLMAQLRALPAAPEKTIRFFDRRDFYCAYGDDALFVADTFNKTRATVKLLSDGESSLPSQTLAARLMPDVLRRLVREKNLSFEIWAQGEGRDWRLAKRGSPGNFDESDFAENEEDRAAEGPGLMAGLHVTTDSNGLLLVGLAYVDLLKSTIGVAQFADIDTLANAESALLQLGVTEVVAQKTTGKANASNISRMLGRAGITHCERPAKDFVSGPAVFGEIQRLLDPRHHAVRPEQLPELAPGNCVPALAGLLRVLELGGDGGCAGKLRVVSCQPLAERVRLDGAAIAALQLFPSAGDAHKSASLFGRLNCCATSMGSRKLAALLRQPLTDASLIEQRLDAVEGLVQDGELRRALFANHLRGLPDAQRLASRFSRNRGSLADVVRLYQAVQCLPQLGTALAQSLSANVSRRFSPAVAQLVADFANFCAMVEATLDLAALEKEGQLRVRPAFDDRLVVLSETLAKTMRALSAEVEAAGRWCKKVEMEEKKGVGLVIKTAKSAAKAATDAARQDGVDLIEIANTKSGFLFRTPKFDKAARQHAELQREYERVQSGLVEQLLGVVSGYVPSIELLSELLSDLDVFCALATVASSSPLPYCRPTLAEAGTGDTIIKGARHPCLEAGEGVFIANDVELRRGSREVVLLTGPNMGGKSTYIRSAALCTLLAQCGAFVPAERAQVALVDAVLCRVGAADSQARGVSTFMAEVCTPRSLLVIDELGRGTSTHDGYGLARAMAEHVASVGCFSFFATHFHELTKLEQLHSNVANMHVSARTDQHELVLLYEVRPGPCDQSFGIHVAELARFPARVVAMARRKAEQLEAAQFRQPLAEKECAEPVSKRSRSSAEEEEEREGEREIEAFLEQLRDVPEGEGQLAASRALLSRLAQSPNPLVRRLLSAE